MYTSKLIVLTIIVLLVAACAPINVTPTPIQPTQTQEAIQGLAVVQSVEIQITQNSPLQVNVIAKGQLPDTGCTTIKSVNQTFAGNTFNVTLTTSTDSNVVCALALTPFEQVIALDVTNLTPAVYIVGVNGAQTAFELLPRDLTLFKQELVTALNARNYELLKLMMDQSLFIALYRSQGNAYDPQSAIEQLQINHIGISTPITADFNKDLTPFSIDPLSTFGLDVGPNHALFVSGWGMDGKDEAVLYLNYLQDGSLYWHGLIVAKGGFAQTNSTPIPPVVDTSVYPTTVQYIMAKQDVAVYNGPGTQYGIVGTVFGGQIAQVTGTNFNGSWWRVLCPDGSAGDCWVSASQTEPTTPPQSNPPPSNDSVQSTQVQFVMAQKDISIYNGPGTQFTIIGSVAGGQTIRVTGVSADGNWWRVMCPDDTVGSCWVSANTNSTKPSNGL